MNQTSQEIPEQESILLHSHDNTVTALAALEKGHVTVIEVGGTTESIEIRDPVPYAHKFARRFIAAGEDVIKYGEVIGAATANIEAGAHVHVHNVQGKRA